MTLRTAVTDTSIWAVLVSFDKKTKYFPPPRACVALAIAFNPIEKAHPSKEIRVIVDGVVPGWLLIGKQCIHRVLANCPARDDS